MNEIQNEKIIITITGPLFRDFDNQNFQFSLHVSWHLRKIAMEECDADGDRISLVKMAVKKLQRVTGLFLKKKKKNVIWFCIDNFINKHQKCY